MLRPQHICIKQTCNICVSGHCKIVFYPDKRVPYFLKVYLKVAIIDRPPVITDKEIIFLASDGIIRTLDIEGLSNPTIMNTKSKVLST